MNRFFKHVALLSLTLAACGTALAQSGYPDRPIRLILGFAPGGVADGAARIAAQILSESLGQPANVENRAGAGGSIAATTVARAAPDGYTLLVHATSDIINPILNKDLGYSLTKDFAPLGMITNSPNVLVVHPSLPVNSVAEFVAYARTRPVSYGSAGVNTVSHLSGALLSAASGAPMLHVPYKGTGAAQMDLLSGRLSFMFDGASTSLTNAQMGKVKALAVTSPQRWPSAPSLPTVAESGYPGYSLLAIFGLMAPAGTPEPVLARIAGALQRGLQTPAVREQIEKLGAQPGTLTREAYGAFLREETARWSKLAADGVLRKED
ncbi:MAG: tripartite tricarboxylate transporter substrate binding protein [Burkholderiales bacterium]|nr:tripartite tricarboxylate transporter substrate binding protein [Burkholderiales bacterium]